MSASLPNLEGDWIGRYPGHYDEVVRITQRGRVVQALKVTGDDHVPAGEITWRADLATGAGEGHVAEKEFRSPRFVPGKLLVHSPERIEFIWENVGAVEYRRDD
jgi:hypothetical protein